MLPNNKRKRDSPLPGYRPGAGKAPRSRANVTSAPESNPSATTLPPVPSPPAAFFGGGKDLSFYGAIAAGANTLRPATSSAKRLHLTIDDSDEKYGVPVGRGTSTADAAANSPGANAADTPAAPPRREKKNIRTTTTPDPPPERPHRVKKPRPPPRVRHAPERPVVQSGRSPSPVFPESRTPEPFIMPPPDAYAIPYAGADNVMLSGPARLANVQRQIREAEARLSGAVAAEAQFSEQITARLEYGSTRWTRREGIRASRRGPAGKIGDWGLEFEKAVKSMADMEAEAGRACERQQVEDGVEDGIVDGVMDGVDDSVEDGVVHGVEDGLEHSVEEETI